MKAVFPDQLDAKQLAVVLRCTDRAVRQRAAAEGWCFTEQPVRGGRRRYYPLTALPDEIAQALRQHALRHAGPTSPTRGVTTPAPNALQAPAVTRHDPRTSTEAERAAGDFRTRLIDEVIHLADSCGMTDARACREVLEQGARGELYPALQVALASARTARGRKSDSGLPSMRTLQRLVKQRREGGSLIPQPSARRVMVLEQWHALALDMYRRPQKPTISQVQEELAEVWRPELGACVPSYDQVRRFLRDKVSQGDLLVGRHSGSALRALKPYTPRTAAGLLPWQFMCADGWNTHFRAPHPVTGEFMTLEIWHFHDVATRYVPPVSIGLKESARVIVRGIENAMRVGGRIRELMTDHTGSVKNDRVKNDPLASLAARAGFTVKHPATVGNSQANGISENFNQYLDREARALATYQNPKVMDERAFKRVGKFSAKMVKAAKGGDLVVANQLGRQAQKSGGGGLVFGSYAEAVDWINDKIDKFNRRPHRSLPKVINPETGRKEHQSPQARLQQFLEEGWAPIAVDEATLVDLFRTHVRKKVVRGMVSAYNGQLYKHEALWAYTGGEGQPGAEVLVAYDPMDWRSVWVKTLDGVFICEAEFVAATGYSTLTAQEAADKKLMQAQIRHKQSGIEQIQRRAGGLVIDAAPAQPRERLVDDVVGPLLMAQAEQQAAAEPAQPAARPETEDERMAKVVQLSLERQGNARPAREPDYLDQMADLMERLEQANRAAG